MRLLVQGMVWPMVLSLPGNTAWKASFATCKGRETDLGTVVLVPLAERRVLGPDAGVQARVPVQVTKNRPIGTCTAYPGLLERGHGLRQGFGPPLGACGFIPSGERVFDPSPGALGYHRTVWREVGGAGWLLQEWSGHGRSGPEGHAHSHEVLISLLILAMPVGSLSFVSLLCNMSQDNKCRSLNCFSDAKLIQLMLLQMLNAQVPPVLAP